MNFRDVISELNGELFEKFGDTEMDFGYTTNGYVDVVTFDDVVLWHSENDDREFDEEKNDWEPFEPFIKRKFNEWVTKLNKLNELEINRVEVIDETGRAYVNWKPTNKVTTSIQDGGRTLKVFVNKNI